MGVKYNKLFKLLIDKKMMKSELCRLSGVSKTTLAKLGKDKSVTVDALEKICNALRCDFSDIMEMDLDPLPESDKTSIDTNL